MYVWNVRCKDYRPGLINIPQEKAEPLLKSGDVEDPRIGGLSMSKPEFTVDDYKRKVVEAASSKQKVVKKTVARKKKATRKKAKK